MTKLHFEMLARSLAFSKPGHDGERMQQWENDITAVIWVCEQVNSAFDRTRFRNRINQMADARAAELAERR